MKTQININPITVNFLDKRFQKVLFPFRCFQHMVFLSSVSIEYNPHRACYYIVSFIGVLVFICFHLFILFSSDFVGVNLFTFVFIKVNVILVAVPIIFFNVLNIMQRKNHVRFILKIQKAFIIINFKQYNKPALRNWSVILQHIFGYVVSVALTRNLPIDICFTLSFILM